MRILLCVFLLLVSNLGKGADALPPWAAHLAQEAAKAQPPQGVNAWVLLQRIELAYSGEGEYLRHQYRLVRVLTEGGKREATFALSGMGGKSGKVKKLLGWNLRPDGDLVKLESDDVFSIQGDQEASFSTRTVTTAQLSRVIPGSLVAFESIERVKLPMGPAEWLSPMEDYPVRQWEMTVGSSGMWLRPTRTVQARIEVRHFLPWIERATIGADSIVAKDLPPIPRDEPLHPHAFNALPTVSLVFLDPQPENIARLDSWDEFAKWVHRSYLTRFQPIRPVQAIEITPKAALSAILAWMNRELLYKQVYLTPERGWIPEFSEEVLRRRYGDCKDLTACLAGAAMAAGYEPHPVLARVSDGALESDLPVNPYSFNHVITAIRLKETLGLPAEVETKRGRFLLIDPTSRLTAFGELPQGHRLGRVMICLEDGAEWVDIPAHAIQEQSLDVVISGTLTEVGVLVGDFRIAERGNAAGLRHEARLGRPDELKELVIQLLGLTATADLDLVPVERADAIDHPIEVRGKLMVPRFLTRSGGDYLIGSVGFPGLLPALPRSERPRLFPLESLSSLRWNLKLELDLPLTLAPVCTARSIQTPFRTASWSAKIVGKHLSAEYAQQRHDARFGPGKQEEGLQAARKDRSQQKGLLEDAISFTKIE
ncbi:MAG TPA: hypothetical protein VJ486_07710 [Geothrix sp.]|nr:hypothetical protein [Geothrix sp.]